MTATITAITITAMTIRALVSGLVVVASVTAGCSGPQTASTSAPDPSRRGEPSFAFGAANAVVSAPMGAAAAARTAAARGGRARPDRDVGAAQPVTPGPRWTLQLNLCNSGEADCYAGGKAVHEGGDLIYRLRPSVVTLNEICANDLPDYLLPSLGEAWPNDWVYHVFVPAVDKRTGDAYRCQNGYEFGNAVLGRVPDASFRGVKAWGGRYTGQDGSTEDRTFACAYAVGDQLACVTHLSSYSEAIALAQCRALLFDAVPHIRSVTGFSGRTIVAGDLNLRYDTPNCVPPGHLSKGDGDVQHVIFSADLTVGASRGYQLEHTDHNGFLVKLIAPG